MKRLFGLVAATSLAAAVLLVVSSSNCAARLGLRTPATLTNADQVTQSRQPNPPSLAALSASDKNSNSDQKQEASGDDHASHGIPRTFIPVDTSRLMGSPDPLPLEPEWAFPALRFGRPVELTHAGDGTNRLFVVELPGVIRVFENRDDVQKSKVFLDLRSSVWSEGYEEGLLGLAFHPKFKQNGEFYVFYTTLPCAAIISRFHVSISDPDAADLASEQVLLRFDRPSHEHIGGCLRFGPDGYLYIGLGDGGSLNDDQGNGQNRRTLLGSILRIDVDRADPPLKYAIPSDNPFVGRDDARGEVWAKGIRNTWRMAFDRKTGDLWAGDVGQHRFEEINVIRRGGNYGWNIREGFEAFQPDTQSKPEALIDPVVAYDRGRGEAVTGGQVYYGEKLKGFQGAYFYADYVSGAVWIIRWDGRQVVENRQVASVEQYITAFGEDAAGELYLCTYDGWLVRLRPRDFDVQTVASRFPRKLSETGLLVSVKDHEPAAGLIPFDVNMPFWSDYAVKDRYVALPARGKVRFDEREKWDFPVGTVFVKTIWMHRDRAKLAEPTPLETRLLVRSPDGWAGYTYVYNEDQTDAELLDGSLNKSIRIHSGDQTIYQPYYFPSRSDCLTCHTREEGFVLGMTTRQLNRTLHYRGEHENQIAMFNRLGVFERNVTTSADKLEKFPDWGFGNLVRSSAAETPQISLDPPQGDAAALSKAWLDVNCAVCHRPRGIAPHYRDFRFHTPLAAMNLVNQIPNQGQLSLPGSLVLKPGFPEESELLFRIAQRGPRQMPPLATHLTDLRALEVMRKWIRNMPPDEMGAPPQAGGTPPQWEATSAEDIEEIHLRRGSRPPPKAGAAIDTPSEQP